MYQTSRSQRVFWSKSRKEKQKQRRASKIKTIIQQDASLTAKGYDRIKALHLHFLKRVRIQST